MGFQRYFWYGSGLYRHFTETIWRPLLKAPARSSVLIFFLLSLIAGALISTRLISEPSVAATSAGTAPITTHTTQVYRSKPHIPVKIPKKPPRKKEFPLNCPAGNLTLTCPIDYPTKFEPEDDARTAANACPDYFRWIHEDLRPWKTTGITRDMVARARRTADFRLVIVNGKVYIETVTKAFQTRDVFTIWGILQLLRRYPGLVPDLELMFDCVDWPVIQATHYRGRRGRNAVAPPPLFRYCGNDATLDIVFPDWSFWGWAEVNIKPWETLSKDLKEGNKKVKWMDREPYAYWKGNPAVAVTRQELLNCNVSDKQDWNARVYIQDWIREMQEGYKQSNLADQCIHRYKIYIEGSAWSVSEKYILACDSVSLLVTPHYYDFFTRGLIPVHHYWPIREEDKCKSIKFAVDWGNSHKKKAQEIGRAASSFMQEDLKMDYVYDYMFHLLNGYSKLLRFKPTIPEKAVEVCSETMACPREGNEKNFMMESLVKGPSEKGPCTLPPPFNPAELRALERRKANSIKQVENWEKNYWENQPKQA